MSYPHFSNECSEHHSLVKDFFPDSGTGERPNIICLCGSTRFRNQFNQANYRLTLAGHIVLSVGFFVHAVDECPNCDASQSFAKDQGAEGPQGKCWQCGSDLGCTLAQKIKLDELHKRKIDLADEVFVLNVCGYIGKSTRSEIDYAKKHGKVISYLEPEGVY
jgi:hypothetical protein